MTEYFFDTYAIIEILLENKNYGKFKSSKITTSTLNLMEVYYFLLRTYNKKTADFWMRKLKVNMETVIPLDLALKSCNFRFENKKAKLSYVDCLGYFLAKEKGLKFLTGDKEFEKMDNVEFVK